MATEIIDDDVNCCMRTEEQELMAQGIKEFCEANVTEEAIKEAYNTFSAPKGWEKAYMEAGYSLMGLPEEYGGIPASLKSRVIVKEEISRNTGAVLPDGNALVMDDICSFGTPEQIEFFSKIFFEQGKTGICMAISEPNAGSDNAAMSTTVKKVGDKLILNGQKTFVSDARNSNYVLVVAKDESPARENKEWSWWIMPIDTPGIKLVDVTEISFRTAPFSDVYFDNVEVDESMLLGRRGAGFMQLMKNFEVERVLLMGVPLGLAQCAMDDAAAYASVRETFGKPIGSYQLIQEKLVEMQVRLNNMRNFLYKIAWEHDHGRAKRVDYALVKYYVSKAATEVCEMAMDIYAGIGYTTDTRVNRCWMDSKGLQYGGGTREIMVHIAGRQLLKEYAK